MIDTTAADFRSTLTNRILEPELSKCAIGLIWEHLPVSVYMTISLAECRLSFVEYDRYVYRCAVFDFDLANENPLTEPRHLGMLEQICAIVHRFTGLITVAAIYQGKGAIVFLNGDGSFTMRAF